MFNFDVGKIKKRHHLSGSEYRKRRAAAEVVEINKQSGLMFKFFKPEQSTENTLLLKTDEDACTNTISNNDVMEINVTNEYNNTIKPGIIDEDIRSEVTDFNLENDQIDYLNLDIDIIKDPAKWPVVNDKIKLLLV